MSFKLGKLNKPLFAGLLLGLLALGAWKAADCYASAVSDSSNATVLPPFVSGEIPPPSTFKQNASQAAGQAWQLTKSGLKKGVEQGSKVLHHPGAALQQGFNLLTAPTNVLPGSQVPVQTAVIIAVPRHGNEKVYSNVSLLVGRALARKLKVKQPVLQVLNPIETQQALAETGQGARYAKFITDFKQTAQPDVILAKPLLTALSQAMQLPTAKPVERLLIVEAELTLNTPAVAMSKKEKIRQWFTDDIPTQMRYPMWVRVQAFDPKTMTRLWIGEDTVAVTAENDLLATPSVFQDSQNVVRFEMAAESVFDKLLMTSPVSLLSTPLAEVNTEAMIAPSTAPPDLTMTNSASSNSSSGSTPTLPSVSNDAGKAQASTGKSAPSVLIVNTAKPAKKMPLPSMQAF
ncbi:MAG: hypothetical protein VKJ06_06365 [Vampirovibrionales bacterium]|nr:hypothetical protein [Vampirovibrionales bacterium]